MKLNFWQILGVALIVAGVIYWIVGRASQPSPAPRPAEPTVATQPL
jgi:drug/metabolite transporter (DMT)-like permease